MSRRLLGSRPPPGRAWQRHRHPAGTSLLLRGWVAAKPPPAASLLPFRQRSWLLLARKHWVRARAARWLPPGEEPSKRRDTNGCLKKKLMKNKNLREEPAPANADQVLAYGHHALQKAAAILLLAEFRRRWRVLTAQESRPQVLDVFRYAASAAFEQIEREAPEWERWTTLPVEAELTNRSRIGDHLAVTRQLMGFPV